MDNDTADIRQKMSTKEDLESSKKQSMNNGSIENVRLTSIKEDIESSKHQSMNNGSIENVNQGQVYNGYPQGVSPVKINDGEIPDDLKSSVLLRPLLHRGHWARQLQFILTCLGYAVGLGNVWRFPYLVYKHGGGTFFVPYFIMLFFLGAPSFVLECAMGQFSGQGPVTCWNFAPLFRGVGFASVWVTYLIAIYYQVIIAWAFYYMFQSFSTELPWSRCQKPWMTEKCRNIKTICGKVNDAIEDNCIGCGGTWMVEKRKCNYTIEAFTEVQNKSLNIQRIAKSFQKNLTTELSGYEYFENHVTGSSQTFAPGELGQFKPQLIVSLFITWMIVALCLCQGIRSIGKASYVMALAPYLLLTILLVNGLLKDGAVEGIAFYITPVPEKLLEPTVWVDAAIQIFFSLSATLGGLQALSSYNRFNANLLKDCGIVVFGNSATSIYAGFVVFSYIGYIAKDQGVPIDEFAKSGPSLVFGVYPMAMSIMPGSQFWSVVFFLTLIFLGTNTNIVNAETVITSLKDLFPELRRWPSVVALTLTTLFFLQALPMTLDNGVDLLEVFDSYSTGWNSLLIAFCEFIAIGWAYGAHRFMLDIGCMIGKDASFLRLPRVYWKVYFTMCWCYISPIMSIILVGLTISKYEATIDNFTLTVFGFCLTLTSVFSIFGWMIYAMVTTKGSCTQRFKTLISPQSGWGPTNEGDRMIVTSAYRAVGFYVPEDVHQEPIAMAPIFIEEQPVSIVESQKRSEQTHSTLLSHSHTSIW